MEGNLLGQEVGKETGQSYVDGLWSIQGYGRKETGMNLLPAHAHTIGDVASLAAPSGLTPQRIL